MDEPFSIFYAQMDLPAVIQMLKTENNPPLHFILLHYWIKLFGIGPFTVRFLSVLFSSLTAPVVFLVGRRFFNRETGVIAALIFTFSLLHVSYSHEARVYPLFVFLTAISLYYFLMLVNSPENRNAFCGLLTANIFLVYSHYFGFFVVATELVGLLFSGSFRKTWKKMSLVVIALLLAYIPIIVVFIRRFIFSVEHGTWVRKPEITELYGNLNRFMNSRTVMLVFLVIFLIYILLLFRKHGFYPAVSKYLHTPVFRIILTWFLFPYLAMFLISFWAPMFLDRYIIYTSISFYLLLAIFLSEAAIHQPVRRVAAASLLVAMLSNYSLAPDNHRRIGQVVRVINEAKTSDPEAVVIISPDYACLEFLYHYNMSYFRDYKNSIQMLSKENIFPLNAFSTVEKAKYNCQRIIYVDCDTFFAFGKNPISDVLMKSHVLIKSIPVYKIYRINWYRPKC